MPRGGLGGQCRHIWQECLGYVTANLGVFFAFATNHPKPITNHPSSRAPGVRLNNYIRPQYLPPNAPGAPYPKPMEDLGMKVGASSC